MTTNATETEYVVWGIPPGETEEAPLFTRAKTAAQARAAAAALEARHGCSAVRVQTIRFDGKDIDWAGCVAK